MTQICRIIFIFLKSHWNFKNNFKYKLYVYIELVYFSAHLKEAIFCCGSASYISVFFFPCGGTWMLGTYWWRRCCNFICALFVWACMKKQLMSNQSWRDEQFHTLPDFFCITWAFWWCGIVSPHMNSIKEIQMWFKKILHSLKRWDECAGADTEQVLE